MSLFSEPRTAGTPATGSGNDIASGYMLAWWIASIIYGTIVNRDYLRWRAGQTEANAWYNQASGNVAPAVLAPPPTQQPTPKAHPIADELDHSRYFAARSSAASAGEPGSSVPASSPPEPIDINSADPSVMVEAFGLHPSTADRVSMVRAQRRGFQNIDDLVAQANLAPHELIKIQGKVTFGVFHPSPHTQSNHASNPPARGDNPQSGRILDY